MDALSVVLMVATRALCLAVQLGFELVDERAVQSGFESVVELVVELVVY